MATESLTGVWMKDDDETRVMTQELRSATEAFNSEKSAEAIATFEQERSALPDFDVAQYWYAMALRAQGRDQDALNFLQSAVSRCRRKSLLLAEIAELYRDSAVIRDISKSIEYWGRAAFAGKYDYAWGVLGVLFHQCGMFDAVRFASERFREVNPRGQMNADEVTAMFGADFRASQHRDLLEEVYRVLQGGRPSVIDKSRSQFSEGDAPGLVEVLVHLSTQGGVYKNRVKVISIGKRLHDEGGYDRMVEAHEDFIRALTKRADNVTARKEARMLESIWGGIGEWQR